MNKTLHFTDPYSSRCMVFKEELCDLHAEVDIGIQCARNPQKLHIMAEREMAPAGQTRYIL